LTVSSPPNKFLRLNKQQARPVLENFFNCNRSGYKKTVNKKTVRENIFSHFFNALGPESGGGCPLARDGLFAGADTTRKKDRQIDRQNFHLPMALFGIARKTPSRFH
jgi:hypothetical protein